MNNQRGATIAELIIVFLIIIGVAIVSVPAFHYLRHQSLDKKFHEKVGIIKAAVASWHYDQLVKKDAHKFPAKLDDNPQNAACENCFDQVLKQGLKSKRWFKIGPNQYYYSMETSVVGPEENQEGKESYRISYNPAIGTFLLND